MYQKSIAIAALILGMAAQGFGATVGATGDDPVKLPEVRVEGSFTQLSFGVRFRYHLPGAGLKALVLTDAPKSWSRGGLSKGDWIVAIDGKSVEGLGVREAAELIVASAGSPCRLEVQTGETGSRREVTVLLKKGSGQIAIHYP